MTEYCVSVPICGIAVVIVEAENEEDAKRKAMSGQRIQLDDIEEWEVLEHVVEGNCFNGPLNDIEVEEA